MSLGNGEDQRTRLPVAGWSKLGDCAQLDFKPALGNQPYVKMLLLAALLHLPATGEGR